MKRLSVRVLLAFAAIYLIWGSTYLAIRITLETIPPFFGAAMRFLVAGALVYVWLPRQKRTATNRVHLRTALVAGTLMIFGAYGATFWAQQTVPSGVTSLIVATAPLWFVVFSAAMEKRAQTWGGLLGLGLGLAAIVVLLDPVKITQHAVDPWGTLALIFGAASWALGSFHFRKGFKGVYAPAGNALTMLAGGVLLLLLSGVSGELTGIDLTAVSIRSWLALSYLIVFGSILAFSAYLWLLQATDPVKVSTYAYVNPVVAVFLGWLVAGEPMDLRIVISTVTVVVAVVLVIVNDSRPRTEQSGVRTESRPERE